MARAVRSAEGAGRRFPLLAGAVVAVVVLVTSLAAAWLPDPWTDEVATLEASRRSLPQILQLFHTIDLVHGFYYFVVHGWSFLFGGGIFAVRALSAVGAALTAVGVVFLGDRLGGRAVAWWSGIAFALLPIVPLWGAEARSQALVMAVVTWTTVAFVLALEDGRARWWVLYAVGLLLGGYLFVQTVLVIAAHLATLVWRREPRRTWLRWLLAAVLPVLAVAPFALAASRQTGQISWVPRPELIRGAASILINPWFAGSYAVTAACMVWVVVGLVRSWRSSEWKVVHVALPWVVLPAGILLLYSHFLTPMYHPRYLAHGATAVALLVGWGLAAVGRRLWLAVAGAAVIAVASVLVVVPMSGPNAKESSDWGQVSERVAAESHPGDAVVFVPDNGNPRSPRRAMDAFPARFADLQDVGISVVGADRGVLWSSGQPLATSVASVRNGQRLWVLAATRKFPAESSAAITQLQQDGYSVSTVWSGPTTTLVLAERN